MGGGEGGDGQVEVFRELLEIGRAEVLVFPLCNALNRRWMGGDESDGVGMVAPGRVGSDQIAWDQIR